MPRDKGLKWASGPKRAKAQQIPDHVWEHYKAEIRRIYASKTLTDLAAEMKRIHGFDAKLRQYTARFKRWGFKKYKTKHPILNVMVEVSNENINHVGNFSLSADASKRYWTGSNIDNNGNKDREGTKEVPSGAPSATRLQTDYQPAPLPQTQVYALAEDICVMKDCESVLSRYDRDFTVPMTDTDLVQNPINDRSANLPQVHEKLISAAPIVPLALRRTSPFDLRFARNIDLEFCSKISKSVKGYEDPDQGLQLSIEAGQRLKIIADHLFVMKRFKKAARLYLILFRIEESRADFSFTLCTPSLVSGARAARSKQHCNFAQNMLLAVMGPERNMGSSAEQFLVYILLANLNSGRGEVDQANGYLTSAQCLASKLWTVRDPLMVSSLYLLTYVYYKWVRHSAPLIPASNTHDRPAPRSKALISSVDFKRFFFVQRRTHECRASEILQDIREDLQWCRKASTWFESSSTRIIHASGQGSKFVNLWTMWHGGSFYFQPEVSQSKTRQDKFGISLAEHLDICAAVIDVAPMNLEFYESDDASTLYLQTLFDRIEIAQKSALNLKKDQRHRTQAPAVRPVTPSHEPTMASSLESANSSLGRLKEASTKMEFHRLRGSHKPGTAISTPGMSYSSYGSNPSMSILSEMLQRSCSVSMSSPPPASGLPKSLLQHEETPANDIECLYPS